MNQEEELHVPPAPMCQLISQIFQVLKKKGTKIKAAAMALQNAIFIDYSNDPLPMLSISSSE
jgi:hypothetical protein